MPFGGGLKKLATNLSLNSSKNIRPLPEETIHCLFDPPSRGGLLDREGAESFQQFCCKILKLGPDFRRDDGKGRDDEG